MKRKIAIFAAWFLTPMLAIAGLESATYINQLVNSNPTGTDHYSTADDHLRLLKAVLLNSFPQISGAVTATQTELNILDGALVSTTELNLLDGRTGTLWTSTNDGAASTLDADLFDGADSTLYGRLDQAETAAGIWAFNGGTTGVSSPFTVDSQQVVVNLNADLLDGLNESAFAQLGTTETVTGIWTYNAIPAFNGGTSGSSAPFSVDSTQVVTNLNADLLDGNSSAAFATTAHSHAETDITDGSLLARNAAAETITGIWAFNGGTSGASSPFSVDSTFVVTNLNADLLDGSSASAFATASHNHDASNVTTGTLAIARGGTGTTNGTARNITGKAGTAKTLSTSSPSGGSDGDIWYRY